MPKVHRLLGLVVALLVTSSHASSQSTPEVVRLVRLTPVTTPILSSTESADYVARVLAILDACARTAPTHAEPYAGRARLVVTVDERSSSIDVVDVEPAIADLRERCLRNTPPLPPLAVPPRAGRAVPVGRGSFVIDVLIDARGLPAPGARIEAPVRVEIDATSLTLDQYDGRLQFLDVRDDLLRGLSPHLVSLGRCVDANRPSDVHRPIRVHLRVDRRGRIGSVEVDELSGLSRCLRTTLESVRLDPWRSTIDTVLAVDLVLR